jgi:hypothetical protein
VHAIATRFPSSEIVADQQWPWTGSPCAPVRRLASVTAPVVRSLTKTFS